MYSLPTLPSFNGESVIMYSCVFVTDISPASSGTFTVIVALNLPASVGLPDTTPVFSSIVNPAGRPSALYFAPSIGSLSNFTSSFNEPTFLLTSTVNESWANNCAFFPFESTLYNLAVKVFVSVTPFVSKVASGNPPVDEGLDAFSVLTTFPSASYQTILNESVVLL